MVVNIEMDRERERQGARGIPINREVVTGHFVVKEINVLVLAGCNTPVSSLCNRNLIEILFHVIDSGHMDIEMAVTALPIPCYE